MIQSVDYLPYFVMQAQGFAAREGLQMEETTTAGGVAALDALLTGSIDVSYAGTPQIMGAAKTGLVPASLLPVAGISFADAAHRGQAVLAHATITSWNDLDGKTIGVNQIGSIGELAMRLRLAQEGVHNTSYVEISLPNLGLAVAGGTISAAVLNEPFVSQSVLRNDGHVLDWVIGGGVPFPEFQQTMLVFRTGFANEHPAVVKAFLRAHLDAVRWIEQHPSEARTVLGHRLRLTPEVMATVNMIRFAPDGRSDPRLLMRMQQILRASDASTPVIDPQRLYDESLLDLVLDARTG